MSLTAGPGHSGISFAIREYFVDGVGEILPARIDRQQAAVNSVLNDGRNPPYVAGDRRHGECGGLAEYVTECFYAGGHK